MKHLVAIVALVLGLPATLAVAAPSGSVAINLKQALGPDNQYTDAALNLSLTLPKGWSIREAYRWGEGRQENTVALQAAPVTSAVPSIYYRRYTEEDVRVINSAGSKIFLEEGAMLKEASRVQYFTDYRNEPESVRFFTINDRPAMTYLAMYSQGDRLMAEHFIRVLGRTGYVMFFTRGAPHDVKALTPQLLQMASTVQAP